MSLIDDFNLLEIPTNATEQDAKAAYRRLARRYHPDKNPGQDTTEHFQRIQSAYRNVLSAIKRSQGQNWQPYQFTEKATRSNSRDFDTYEFESDAKQRAYVKEQQRAYEEMRRGNAQHEKAKEEALKSARSTLHQRRMHALYEEMRKAEQTQEGKHEHPHSYTDDTFGPADTDPLFADYFDSTTEHSQQERRRSTVVKPIKLNAAKAAFLACTYIATFTIGVYSAGYWKDLVLSDDIENTATYVSGLYPQYRSGINYTLSDTRLFTEPNLTSEVKTMIPENQDVSILKSEGDWLTMSYGQYTGWARTANFGFGTYEQAKELGCIGQPGEAPKHGDLIGNAEGNSRLRILNQLTQASILTFQSLDGQKPFSIYLNAEQPFAANFIPKGNYKLVLNTGSLYHQACQRFLFDERERVVLDQVTFNSAEQTLTLRNLLTP